MERIIDQGIVPHNQRAEAIVAENEGVTRKKISEITGLTTGKIRYWVKKFHVKRLEIFPEDCIENDSTIEDSDDEIKLQKEIVRLELFEIQQKYNEERKKQIHKIESTAKTISPRRAQSSQRKTLKMSAKR